MSTKVKTREVIPHVEGLTGDAAIAHALKQANLDVLAAYPITPQLC
jgi:pyruvate/2-oxoacid:ferredoxin oxidoreductase alpha subunit